MVTRKDKTKKLNFSVSWDELNLKDIFKLISIIGTFLSALLIYFHIDTKSGQNDLKLKQDSVAQAVTDPGKLPRGTMSAKLLKNDSLILLYVMRVEQRDSEINDNLKNLTRADNQIAGEAIAMHNRDSVRLDQHDHSLATVFSLIPKHK